jgi:hypothetical protein
MAKTVSLTPRDHELLLGLVQKVRLFSLRQIASHWWDNEVANTRRRLKTLASSALISHLTVAARTLPPIETPLAVWQPAQPAPDMGKLSYQLQSRWRQRPVRAMSAYVASSRAAQLFGGKSRGELKHPLQATHDLGVAAIWLNFHDRAPEWADAWRGEDLLAHTRLGEKLPDGFIVNQAQETVWVIEFGGAYDASRVQEFHDDCARRDLPYQIW